MVIRRLATGIHRSVHDINELGQTPAGQTLVHRRDPIVRLEPSRLSESVREQAGPCPGFLDQV